MTGPLLRAQPAWMLAGACVGVWALFDADDPASIAAAKDVCSACPVRAECLAHALATGERWGVRGGLDPAERAQLAARRGFPRPSIKGLLHDRTTYTAGCRCGDCRADNARYVRELRARGPVTPRGVLFVVLAEPVGRGKRRAYAGQVALDLGRTA